MSPRRTSGSLPRGLRRAQTAVRFKSRQPRWSRSHAPAVTARCCYAGLRHSDERRRNRPLGHQQQAAGQKEGLATSRSYGLLPVCHPLPILGMESSKRAHFPIAPFRPQPWDWRPRGGSGLAPQRIKSPSCVERSSSNPSPPCLLGLQLDHDPMADCRPLEGGER